MASIAPAFLKKINESLLKNPLEKGPLETLLDGKSIWAEKNLAQI